jgi:phage terminase small subunit
MAGIKGRSGGARVGAGRPKKSNPAPVPIQISDRDMLQLLQDIALGKIDATPMQVKAAIAAVKYTHAVPGDKTKRETKQQEAEAAAQRFGSLPPPRLASNGGKPV